MQSAVNSQFRAMSAVRSVSVGQALDGFSITLPPWNYKAVSKLKNSLPHISVTALLFLQDLGEGSAVFSRLPVGVLNRARLPRWLLQSGGRRGKDVRGNGSNVGEEDLEFEQRLKKVSQSSAKKPPLASPAEVDAYGFPIGALNYDKDESQGQSADSDSNGSNPLVKVGAGVAAALLALVFVFGDIFPASNTSPTGGKGRGGQTELTSQQKATLQLQVDRFSSLWKNNPKDLDALESLAVSHAQLGEYQASAQELQQLMALQDDSTSGSSNSGSEESRLETLRLLAEVLAADGQPEASADVYTQAVLLAVTAAQQPGGDASVAVELLQSLVETLIQGGKTEQAVSACASLKQRVEESGSEDLAVLVELLYGRALSANQQFDEAVAVYDSLAALRKEDYRPYLAKAILRMVEGEDNAEAKQLFLQARFLAPENAKGAVERLMRSSKVAGN